MAGGFREDHIPAPELPDDVSIGQLDRDVRARLRGLTKENAEVVGRHLVMVGRLLDAQPELAYEHAQAAVRRGGRVDVVREAAGLAAYRTERYAEALRELRTVRRLNGSSEHLPIMADCERGLGRPERAIALAGEPEAQALPGASRVELAMVVSGARLDLGQAEAAVAVLDVPLVRGATGLLAVRVAQARAQALEAAGRTADAAAELEPFTAEQLAEAAGETDDEDDEEIVVFDLADDDGDGQDVDAADDEESVAEGPVDDSPDGAVDAASDDEADEADADGPVDEADHRAGEADHPNEEVDEADDDFDDHLFELEGSHDEASAGGEVTA